ncbi:MAG: hypothetical protein VCE91_10690 [Nitrospinota bacterium]
MDRSSEGSRGELLALLHKQIMEREASRDSIDKSIQILKDAERELCQQDIPPARGDEEQAEYLPYRIHTPPAAAESAFILDEPQTPEPVHSIDPNDPEEISLLARPPDPQPPVRRMMDVGEPPPLLQGPTSPARDARAEEPSAPFRNPAALPPERVDDILQEEQISLLGRQKAQPRLRREPPESAPPEGRTRLGDPFLKAIESDVGMEIPARAALKLRTNGGPARAASPPRKPLPAAIERLMKYIRGGGAVRCQDPWGQNCAAFLVASDGSFVLATDVFLNYVRKSIQLLRKLHEKHLVDRASSPSTTGHLEELETRKRFLGILAQGLSKQSPSVLQGVPGLRMSGQNAPTDNFEFENSTKAFLHAGFLGALQELLAKPADIFFLAGGSYFEIADFLGQHKNFTRETGEEALAVAMLGQLGLAPGPKRDLAPAPPRPEASAAPPVPAPPPVVPESDPVDLTLDAEDEVLELDDPEEPAPPLPDPDIDTSSFMDEADDLQNLNTFDFDPSDKKSIMEQQEDVLSMSKFKGGEIAGPPEENPFLQSPSTQEDERPFGVGEISPSGHTEKPIEEEFRLSPERADAPDSFNLNDLEKLLDDKNRPG